MKAILNWRYYVIIILGILTVGGIFAVPNDDLGQGEWMFYLILTKMIGFSAGFLNYKLTLYWEDKGLIPEYSKLIQDIEEE